jgi:lipopolysaccharide/colanic/teichoic acid biosynthesis glycosyltransferase
MGMTKKSRNPALRGGSRPVWSLFQRCLAAIMLIACLPVLLVLWILVRRDSPGPFLFWQKRPGLNMQPIRVCKIRTMTVGADRNRANGLGVTREHPDVTGVGRWLRALKLDEIPQLWNVVRGDMEFVGPRPIAESLVELLTKEVAGFEDRFRAKPGLTSVGQVSIVENSIGTRLVADWQLRHEAEIHHLTYRSAGYDIVVIALTVAYLIRGIGRELSGYAVMGKDVQEEGSSESKLLTLR